MAPEPIPAERVLAYLLAELPSEELAEIDQRLLEDDSFGDAFEEVRNDILDRYAQGRLAPEQRDRVRRALNLASGGRDPQLEFSRGLRRALRSDRSDAPRSSTRRTAWRLAAWSLPLAAGLVLAVGLWTMQEQSNHRESEGLSRPDFVLLLTPEVLRGGSTPQTLSVPKDVTSLTVQVAVPDPGARYAVRVQSPSGEATFGALTPRTESGVTYVQFSIPRARLASQTTDFVLYRATPGAKQLLERYRVRLIAP